MDLNIIAEKIIKLRNNDEALRNELIKKGILSDGYNEEMEALHNSHSKELNRIMDMIGYPTSNKVGEDASEAAWFIIQHAIGQPAFMKKSAELLQQAVQENKADPVSLAYLTDRIAVLEGKPQLYGTQFAWDENGEMSPNSFDDLNNVNHRRKSIGLNTLEEQIQMMRARVKSEHQHPPKDYEEKKRAYNDWRKKVGWIK